jgi:hypothetical protein
MTSLDEMALFDVPPDPARPEREPRKCRRHEWTWAGLLPEDGEVCRFCGRLRDVAVSRRSRNNRARGGRAELDVARTIGGEKVGPLGHPWDVTLPGYMRLQVKKLARWPSLAAVIGWMAAIPAGNEMRAVAVVEAAGPGRKPRRLLVLDLDEFARWHGDPTEGA